MLLIAKSRDLNFGRIDRTIPSFWEMLNPLSKLHLHVYLGKEEVREMQDFHKKKKGLKPIQLRKEHQVYPIFSKFSAQDLSD